jgi:hypothetical protein
MCDTSGEAVGSATVDNIFETCVVKSKRIDNRFRDNDDFTSLDRLEVEDTALGTGEEEISRFTIR